MSLPASRGFDPSLLGKALAELCTTRPMESLSLLAVLDFCSSQNLRSVLDALATRTLRTYETHAHVRLSRLETVSTRKVGTSRGLGDKYALSRRRVLTSRAYRITLQCGPDPIRTIWNVFFTDFARSIVVRCVQEMNFPPPVSTAPFRINVLNVLQEKSGSSPPFGSLQVSQKTAATTKRIQKVSQVQNGGCKDSSTQQAPRTFAEQELKNIVFCLKGVRLRALRYMPISSQGGIPEAPSDVAARSLEDANTWQANPGIRHPSGPRVPKLYGELTRRQAGMIIQVQRGHAGLNAYLPHIAKLHDMRIPETVEHFLMVCKNLRKHAPSSDKDWVRNGSILATPKNFKLSTIPISRRDMMCCLVPNTGW
ncbi:hypothetical protein BDZ89DRAFT_1138923 [Hymenopellis radicata]|nr:hypothetical protein BDZ89DRAFT_1138923 [Hymenopellis radicata]